MSENGTESKTFQENYFSPSLSSFSHGPQTAGYARNVVHYNRGIVTGIVNKIFDEKKGYNLTASSSNCSSISNKLKSPKSEHSYDRRLSYWRNMIEERKQIAEFVKKKTGKKTNELLFSRKSTVDECKKRTVQRLMDYAERMTPSQLLNPPIGVLPEYVDGCKRICVHELRATQPSTNVEMMEISGMPCLAKCEPLDDVDDADDCVQRKSDWLKSELLQQRIQEKHKHIERVLEFYPDIDNLQIVGKAVKPEQTLSTKIGTNVNLDSISSDTECESIDEQDPFDDLQLTASAERKHAHALLINGDIFHRLHRRSAKLEEKCFEFECHPFERLEVVILQLQNIGEQLFSCVWLKKSCQKHAHMTLFHPKDDEFAFNNKSFRLLPGESIEIRLLFQPRKVGIFKEKWSLRTSPQLFCDRHDAIEFLLHGKCTPHPFYVNYLQYLHGCVLQKANHIAMEQLTDGLSSIVPLIKQNDCNCPYKRELQEREIFELENLGFNCNRLYDLELLKDLYKRIKKPREAAWDLKLDTLKASILRMSNADQRAFAYDEMMSILESMRGQSLVLEQQLSNKIEREHTNIVYVRGIISAAIDEWENLTRLLEQSFLKTALHQHSHKQNLQQEEEQKQQQKQLAINFIANVEPSNGNLHEQLLSEMRKRKAFRDALYIKTYTHICNFVEDIVNIIESGEVA